MAFAPVQKKYYPFKNDGGKKKPQQTIRLVAVYFYFLHCYCMQISSLSFELEIQTNWVRFIITLILALPICFCYYAAIHKRIKRSHLVLQLPLCCRIICILYTFSLVLYGFYIIYFLSNVLISAPGLLQFNYYDWRHIKELLFI